jgi:nitroreductase
VKTVELPEQQPRGIRRSLARMTWDCPAHDHFSSESVPDEDVRTILALATQAPSVLNSQPWRFVVVRDPARRARLARAAWDQPAPAEAPVVIVAFARRGTVKRYASAATLSFQSDAARDPRTNSDVLGGTRALSVELWLHRHVMIAFTYMMIAAEALGWDTAPMEHFDAGAVRAVLDLPHDAEVVAMLAIGRRFDPEPVFPDRLRVEELAFADRFGNSFNESEHEATSLAADAGMPEQVAHR